MKRQDTFILSSCCRDWHKCKDDKVLVESDNPQVILDRIDSHSRGIDRDGHFTLVKNGKMMVEEGDSFEAREWLLESCKHVNFILPEDRTRLEVEALISSYEDGSEKLYGTWYGGDCRPDGDQWKVLDGMGENMVIFRIPIAIQSCVLYDVYVGMENIWPLSYKNGAQIPVSIELIKDRHLLVKMSGFSSICGLNKDGKLDIYND